MSRRPRLLASVVLVLSLAATACTSDEPASEPSPSPTPTSAAPTPSPTPEEVFPLTGEPTDDPRARQPVVSVKIENTPSARPQAGLDAADVVYEQIVEGAVTRFVALFHSELPSDVGPVRSGRLVDVPILEPWGSIMVYSGVREDVTAALARADSIGLLPDSGPPVYRRAPDRPGSHDLMADLPAALEAGADLADAFAAPAPWDFDERPPAGGVRGEAGREIEIRMTRAARTGWTWDRADGVYRRLQNGEPQVVTGDGEVGAANVVVVLTEIGTGACCDTAGNPFTLTRFEGDGDAIVLRDGRRYDLVWRKSSASRHLELVTRAGAVFPLAPGPTWIHLAPTDAVPEPEATASEDA